MAIQPVKAGGKHAFKDEDILAEMENVRVKKVSLKGSGVLEDELVQAWTEEAKSDSELDDCNADITYTEVRRTFDSGSNTPGLDVVTATMIAKADSVLMMFFAQHVEIRTPNIVGCCPSLDKKTTMSAAPTEQCPSQTSWARG